MIDLIKTYRVIGGKKVNLSSYPTRADESLGDRASVSKFTEEMINRMRDLQYRLYVEAKQSLLIVLQAPDAAGKDGTIRRVLGRMNPQGCRTYPFKVPSSLELRHDFLWRIHACVPGAGQVSIFNRSHYEDVLIARVDSLVPPKVWQRRYDHINAFESLLADRGTKILKFYLHISHEEQLDRFESRLDEPEKHWKLNAGDYAARDQWDDYRKAYEDAMRKCSTPESPWFVIPADQKWYRDAVIAGIVAQTLEKMDPKLPKLDVDLEQIRQLYEAARSKLSG